MIQPIHPVSWQTSSWLTLFAGVCLIVSLSLAPSTVIAQSTAESSPSNNTSDSVQTNEASSRPVRSQSLTELMQQLERSAPAQVVSLNHAHVAAQISARITTIRVQVGDRVATGDILAELDCSDYDRAIIESSARLDANETRRKLADQQLKRTRKLARSKTVSEDVLNQRQAEFDVAIADIAAQRAQLARARNEASRCRIPAPFDGVVVKRSGQVGEFTMPGSVIAELVDTANIELIVRVADTDIVSLTTSIDSASDIVFQYADQRYPVGLRTLLPVIDHITRSREARFRFTGELPSVGASGRLVWTLSRRALPAHLITTHNNTMGVFVVNEGTAQFVPLPDALEGRPVLVDMMDSTQIITEGRRALQDGDAIRVVQ